MSDPAHATGVYALPEIALSTATHDGRTLAVMLDRICAVLLLVANELAAIRRLAEEANTYSRRYAEAEERIADKVEGRDGGP